MIVTPPPIASLPAGIPSPLWSVMIPTFNCTEYLRQTLESVLRQDPGPERMQIEVVDDCSTKDDPEKVVAEVGAGRVQFFRKEKNDGATKNFNTCIERSHGRLIHILHGDDYVHPGFYERMEKAATLYPELAIFFARCLIIDSSGGIESLSARVPHLEASIRMAGELHYTNWLLTPGVVVRRSFYEEAGGFLTDLVHVADWEMWTRAIVRWGGVFLNEVLASYRFFPGNETGRLSRSGENLRDYLRLLPIFENHAAFDPKRFRRMVAAKAWEQASRYRVMGDREARRANARLWAELTPWPAMAAQYAKSFVRRLLP